MILSDDFFYVGIIILMEKFGEFFIERDSIRDLFYSFLCWIVLDNIL